MLGCIKVNSTRISLFDDLPRSLFDRVLREFHRAHGPLLLGHLASVAGWSLERTQQAVDVLIGEGTVRHATDDEKSSVDLSRDANAYVLAAERCLTIAHSRP